MCRLRKVAVKLGHAIGGQKFNTLDRFEANLNSLGGVASLQDLHDHSISGAQPSHWQHIEGLGDIDERISGWRHFHRMTELYVR